jgi:hypothetical protein
MSCNDYEPRPIHTSKVRPPREVADSREKLASHARSIWAQQRMADGWGSARARRAICSRA